MEIALIIVGGIIILTVIGMTDDYLTKSKLAKTSLDPKYLMICCKE